MYSVLLFAIFLGLARAGVRTTTAQRLLADTTLHRVLERVQPLMRADVTWHDMDMVRTGTEDDVHFVTLPVDGQNMFATQ